MKKKAYEVYCLACKKLGIAYRESPPNTATIIIDGVKYPVVANCQHHERLELTIG